MLVTCGFPAQGPWPVLPCPARRRRPCGRAVGWPSHQRLSLGSFPVRPSLALFPWDFTSLGHWPRLEITTARSSSPTHPCACLPVEQPWAPGTTGAGFKALVRGEADQPLSNVGPHPF